MTERIATFSNVYMYTYANVSNVDFYFKISIPPEPVFKTWTANIWPRERKWLEHSAWIRRLGVRVPLRLRHFLSRKLWHFHKNIRSCVETKCCCPRTLNISNINFTLKLSFPDIRLCFIIFIWYKLYMHMVYIYSYPYAENIWKLRYYCTFYHFPILKRSWWLKSISFKNSTCCQRLHLLTCFNLNPIMDK